MNNFKRLTNQSRINVKPTKIVVRKVNKNASLKSALAAFGVASSDMEELAIINGMNLGDNVKSGMRLKCFSKKHND